MENAHQHNATNPLYSTLLSQASPKDLVLVMIRRLTRVREIRVARDALVSESLKISDASLVEILLTLQKLLQERAKVQQIRELEDVLNRVSSALETTMQAPDYETVMESLEAVQAQINKVRARQAQNAQA